MMIISPISQFSLPNSDVLCAPGYQDTREMVGGSNIVRHSVSKKLYTQHAVDSFGTEKLKKLIKLREPHILQVLEVCEQGELVFMVSEFVSTHSLLLEIVIQGKLSAEVALNYFAQLCVGVDFLHSRGVVHGNLMSENIIIGKNDTIKISEFGIYNQSNLISDDIKALGTILNEMISGCCFYSLNDPSVCSPEMKEFISMMTERDDFRNVRDIFKHELMKKYRSQYPQYEDEWRKNEIILKLERYLYSQRKKEKTIRKFRRSELGTNTSDSKCSRAMCNPINYKI